MTALRMAVALARHDPLYLHHLAWRWYKRRASKHCTPYDFERSRHVLASLKIARAIQQAQAKGY